MAYGWLSAVNSLTPGRFQWNFRWMIFTIILEIGGWGISYEIALTWISLYFTGDKSTMVGLGALKQQAMIWTNVDPDLCRHVVSLGHNELIFFLLFSHCFLNHFTPQYPQLACLSTQPLCSHQHICFLCHLLIFHNKKTLFKHAIL